MKRLSFLLLCFGFLFGACSASKSIAPAESTSVFTSELAESNSATSELFSVTEKSSSKAGEENNVESSAFQSLPDGVVMPEDFDWPDVIFEDATTRWTYDEYFSEERYMNYWSGTSPNNSRFSGYRYVKGAVTTREDWNQEDFWQKPCDGLYLYQNSTGERVLLADVKDIKQVVYQGNVLYLVTENAVWKCGAYGEDVGLLYEHSSPIEVCTEPCSDYVLYFEADDAIWRLFFPDGIADCLCSIDDLPSFDLECGYIPLTNYAFLFYSNTSCETSWNIYSAKKDEVISVDYSGSSNIVRVDHWVEKYYPLKAQ